MFFNIFRKKKKVGLALCGGGARAFSHIGVLKVLEELGVDIKAIAGTSMGAIIGAIYCSGKGIKEMETYVHSMDWKSFLLFSELSLSRRGLINWRRLEVELKKFLEDKTFKDCRIKFCCVATELITGKKVILSKGKLIDAVKSSFSIPGFLPPVCVDDRVFIDGGIIEPLPTESLKRMGVNYIIASSITLDRDREKYIMDAEGCRKQNKNKLSIRNILDTSLSIVQREMTRDSLNIADIKIEPEVGDFGFFDLTKGDEIIQRGEDAARKKIREIKRRLNL